MPTKKPALFLFGIIIIASFFRLYQIKTIPPGLYPDEAVNGHSASKALRTGDYRMYYPENNGREGLYMNIQALSLRIFNVNEPWTLRIPSAIFGILTVLGIYFLTKELFEERPALLASLFAATSVWHIIFSRIGFRAIMAPFFLVWAMYCLMRAIKKPRFSLAAIGGILFGLGFHTYIAYRVAPLLLIPIVMAFWKEHKFWKIIGVFLAATLMAALPIGLYYLGHTQDFLGRTSQVSIFSSDGAWKTLGANIVKTIGMFFIYGDANWRHNVAGRPELFWPIALFFLVGLYTGAKKTIVAIWQKDAVKKYVSHGLMILWLLAMSLPVVISNEGIPHALRAILMFPPAIILAGVGGILVYDAVHRHCRGLWITIPTVLILSLLIFEAYSTYFTYWGQRTETANAFSAEYTDIAHEINNMPRTNPIYLIADGDGVDAEILNPFDGTTNTVGFPLSSQVIMFITDTFTPEKQGEKQIYYILPQNRGDIPTEAPVFNLN